jgi:hypothetical protein
MTPVEIFPLEEFNFEIDKGDLLVTLEGSNQQNSEPL